MDAAPAQNRRSIVDVEWPKCHHIIVIQIFFVISLVFIADATETKGLSFI